MPVRKKPTKRTRPKVTPMEKTPRPAGVEDLTKPGVIHDGAAHTPGSLARRKRHLLNELKSEGVTPERLAEIRTELDGPLADVPILSAEELRRLGD